MRQEGSEEVSSQTLVGMASGDHNVNVEMNITFDLDVNDEVVVTERVWRDEHDPVVSATTVRTHTRVEKTPPRHPQSMYHLTPGDDQPEADIDEEVALADVPQTGDNSTVWFALILLSVCGLCILHLSDKKCKA